MSRYQWSFWLIRLKFGRVTPDFKLGVEALQTGTSAKEESARMDFRFLEPACGAGNFLVKVLRRKRAADALVAKFVIV